MRESKLLAQYEILNQLGHGGFATVYRARDKRMGREVALKVVDSRLAQEPAFVERFRQEALTAASLRHPNIVPVYDFGEAGGALFLAMALIGQGRTLCDLLSEAAPLSVEQALPLLAQVAEALDYLHGQGLVHRDVKPANILLEGQGNKLRAILTDFGLVRSLVSSAQITPAGDLLGTPAYLAPEQANPQQWGEVTHLTDVYTLGVVAYETLAGRTPFGGELAAVLHAHAHQLPPSPLEWAPELGGDLAQVLLKALVKPPAERYPSAGALVGALQQVAAEQERQQAGQVALDHLLAEAQAARERHDWVAVQGYCAEIVKIDPMHPTMIDLMGEAAAGLKRAGAEEAARRKRQERYEAGEQALAAGQWQTALDAFEQVAAGNPDFREVQARLAQARDEMGRAQAYDEAIAYAEAECWAEACRAWLRVLSGRPDYRAGEAATRLLAAVEGLFEYLDALQKALQQGQHELKTLKKTFQQAQHDLKQKDEALALFDALAAAVEEGNWLTAANASEALLKAAPDLTQPSTWLALARQELADGRRRDVTSSINAMTEGKGGGGPAASSSKRSAPPMAMSDDRDGLQPGDRILLVVEDDARFAKVVSTYAHKKGFKCLLAPDGETGLDVLKTARADAIVLDLNLPGMSGWEVLDALKHNADTRHIPVHIMSVADEDLDAYRRGAMGFLTKPAHQKDLDTAFGRIEEFIARKIKSLLLVEDDAALRKSIRKLLEGSDVAISEAGTGTKALEQLTAQHFDCMILDLTLPDMSGFELLNRLDADDTLPKCPVIIYTGKALTEEENRELLKYADSVIVKVAQSPERLLDETALFLHRVIADMPEDRQRTIKRMLNSDSILADKEILIVDDDARNAFALSKLLADHGIRVHIAVNGQKALEMLDKMPVDLVLMDIMLPGMDGYEITRRIRADERFRRLPILALTAKAMKGDREKCIAAGANDYLAKPVDAERLFSMLRVWLSRD